jgi:hypothetical protein
MFSDVTRDGLPGWPFNELERALDAAATDSSQMPTFWAVLLRSTLVAVAHMPAESEPVDQRGFPVIIFTADEGKQAIVTFTSMELARACITQPVAIVDVPSTTLMDRLGEVSLVLNPRGPVAKELLPAEIRAARQGVTYLEHNESHIKWNIAADTKVFFGALAEEPHELIEAVVSACRGDETVKAAYLSGVCMPAAGDTTAHPLIGIDADHFDASKAKVSRAMGGWTAREKKPVDFVDMRQPSGFANHLRKSGKRIYKRGGWLGGMFG